MLVAIGQSGLPMRATCADVPFAGWLELRTSERYVVAESVRVGCVGGAGGRVSSVTDSGRVVHAEGKLLLFSDVDPGSPDEPYADVLQHRGDTLVLLGPGDAAPYVYVRRP